MMVMLSSMVFPKPIPGSMMRDSLLIPWVRALLMEAERSRCRVFRMGPEVCVAA